MINHKTYEQIQLQTEYNVFNYQKKLTDKLDKMEGNFDQNIINEIVLWKVNRYAELTDEHLQLINSIDPKSRQLNEELTTEILSQLLFVNGIQLPMASTILRFRNKYVYQIIDQRVYRILYSGETLKIIGMKSEAQIALYLKYLKDLQTASKALDIAFEEADRILYNADKDVNREISLQNYGSKKRD